MVSSSLLNLGFGLYRAIFNNFAAEEIGIGAAQYGLLEGIREIPGLLTIVLAALAGSLSDERQYALSATFIGIGIWMYSGAHSYTDLIGATLVQSVGFHMWQVVQDSLVMKSAQAEDRAHRLGLINSVAAAATLGGMGSVWAFARYGLRPLFLWAGIAAVSGALFSLLLRSTVRSEGKQTRFVFRWQYRSYYVLSLLSGARRHMVLTFASFALVKLYGTSTATMAVLLVITNFLAIWTRPLIGKLVGRVGEQRALSLNYAVVALLFLGYAFVRIPSIIYALFILDNLLTGFDVAISTHASRIIPREELSSSLATGSTINHIFGVAVPVMGGFLWIWFGPQIPFLLGTAIVTVAVFYSWNLDARVPNRVEAPSAS